MTIKVPLWLFVIGSVVAMLFTIGIEKVFDRVTQHPHEPSNGVLGPRSAVISCQFDGPAKAGDLVVVSETVAGECHDAGVVIGRVRGDVSHLSSGVYEVEVQR